MSLPNAAPTQPNSFPATPVAPSGLAASTELGTNGFCTPSAQPQRGAETAEGFVDRRRQGNAAGASERRQFGSSHEGLSDPGRELALAIDQYKLQHHRRYITCDEMLHVITSLGYSK